ncbi:MAG: 2,4'-dihydroxyacetophenone dioxygenase family protein [Acidimicrobiia bacterium]|nr:2,4'-dihydroxyacetophenone dioxygenase family protein [Acidimicrobiia bacterium]
MSMTAETAPTAIHRGEDDLPFVDLPDSGRLQLLQVDLDNGVWVVRNQFPPDTTIPTHKHTGHVHAFTQRGSWHYLESPESVNRPGSYLYEPAGSVHTLHVPATNDGVTDVWFTIHGANLNLDADGNVELVIDAHLLLPIYRAACAEQHGIENPPVVVIGGEVTATVDLTERRPSPRAPPGPQPTGPVDARISRRTPSRVR